MNFIKELELVLSDADRCKCLVSRNHYARGLAIMSKVAQQNEVEAKDILSTNEL